MTLPIFDPEAEAPVLLIGAAGVDIVGRLEGKLESGTSNPAKIRFSFGGVARNVAENLARLGQPVRLITAVGSGRYGDQLLAQLVTAGVDVDAVLRTSDFSTGSYLAVLGASGELQYALDDMHAVQALTSDYLHERFDLFKDASLLYLDANLPKKTIRTAMSLARRARLKVFADPTSVALAPRLKPYLSRLHLITPNHAEAAVYCDKSFNPGDHQEALDAAKHLVSQGVSVAIITLAEFGVCYATSETSGYIPAIHTEIVDPTGAGDALSATVIFALLNQIPLDDAIRLGVSAASLTLRFPGAVIPDLSIEMLYDQLVI
jgi:pseudouridine kinase